ncbi:RNA polymerase factor sigma-54 [Lacticaseibacillus sp. N501-2]|uniref:RNA polymerase factor sigma-54 n=1 Tax=Lacticaseibacillus salsurae TaxID=3367729 RepID=UPI0038B40BC7
MSDSQGFQLNQSQSQSLSLSQGMRQSILILQLDAIDLTTYLEDISMANPLISVHTTLDHRLPEADSPQVEAQQPSLFTYLLEQVQLTMRATHLRQIVIYLIQQLDPRGYLALTNDEIAEALGLSMTEVLDAVTLLQRLDPPGVGARDLQECLYLQAEQDPDQIPEGVLALLEDSFDDLVKHRWHDLEVNLTLSRTQLDDCVAYIQTLTSNPGAAYGRTQIEYIVPELKLTIKNGKASLTLNRHSQPELIFAQATYERLSATNDSEVQRYLREKKAQFQSLEYAMQRRQETLIMIGRAIIQAQFEYFKDPSLPLAPLLLRDIAQRLQLSESTVSRTINNKYLQTDHGVYPLKMFFSRYSPATAGESRSTAQLLAALKAAVAQEDPAKPLSDAALAKALSDQGFVIARRTVAKYRQEAGIASARERKK